MLLQQAMNDNRRPVLCAQDSGMARGQTMRVATKKCFRRYVVSASKAVSLDVE